MPVGCLASGWSGMGHSGIARILLLAGMLVAMALGGADRAQAYKPAKAFAEKLTELRCGDLIRPAQGDDEVPEGKIIAMFAPWAPNLHAQLLAALTTDR